MQMKNDAEVKLIPVFKVSGSTPVRVDETCEALISFFDSQHKYTV